jgi:hypothetical protein
VPAAALDACLMLIERGFVVEPYRYLSKALGAGPESTGGVGPWTDHRW